MKKLKVGVTGQGGFIGSHLFRAIALSNDLEPVEFARDFFTDPGLMRDFAGRCDCVVHLAGLSRHPDGAFLYNSNMALVERLLASAHPGQLLLLGSTTHEDKDTPYHASKRDGRTAIERWAERKHGVSRTLLMPNTFGTGSRPFYNSVVSTFCALAARGETPPVIDDVLLKLIDVETLCREILGAIRGEGSVVEIPHRFEIRLPELWEKLLRYRRDGIPEFDSVFDLLLWNVFNPAGRAPAEGCSPGSGRASSP